jgi:hypothetical protein
MPVPYNVCIFLFLYLNYILSSCLKVKRLESFFKNEGGGGPFLSVEFVRLWQRIPYSVVHTDFLDCSNVEVSHSITELKKKYMGI